MFFRNADIEIAFGMRLGEVTQTGAARHGRGNGDDLLIRIGEAGQSLADNFGIGRSRRGGRLSRLWFVFAEAVKFVRLLEGRLVTFALFGEDVKEDRLL